MANQKLQIDILANDKSKQAFNRVQGSIAKVKGAVFNLKNAFIGLGAGLVIRSIVNTGIQIENLGVQLKALFGSAKEGQRALDIVTKFAKTTPFELENIQQGITALATVRKQAESAGVSFEELLKITGNTATVLGGDFALASLQIQRSFSAGIASAELFRERGVTAMAGFQQGVRTSVDQSIKGLAKAFGTGGEFGNLIEELSKTLSGTISNLKDTLFTFQVSITRGFFFELKEQLGDLKQFTEDNQFAIESLGVEVGEKLAVAIVKLSDSVKTLTQNFRDLQSIIGLLAIAFGGFTAKIVGAGLIIDDINRRIKKLANDVTQDFQKIKEFEHELSVPVENLNKELEYTRQLIHDFEHELSVPVPTATEKAIEKFKELNSGALENIKKKTQNIEMIIAEGVNNGITKMSETLAQTIVFGKSLTDTLKNLAQQVLARIIAVLIEQIVREQILVKLGNFKIGQATTLLSIERLITEEKRKQQSASAGGSDNMGSSLVKMASSFLGFAKGGAVSKGQPIVVGENGAELFIPNQTGQITQSARGTGGGGTTTVNFNINTVDASGFEELLVRSRGTITQLINNAVNERGKESLI
jgi:hypothetical protein